MKENRPTHTLMDEQLLQQNIRITKNMTQHNKQAYTHRRIEKHMHIKTEIQKKDTHSHIHTYSVTYTLMWMWSI